MLRQVKDRNINLQNRDFDTGEITRAGEYKLADESYAKLLNKLARGKLETVTPDLRRNILAFYSNLDAPIATKKDKGEWQNTLRALDKLKATPVQASRESERQ